MLELKHERNQTRVRRGHVESDVLAYIDHLAFTQQRNRSFIVNSILRYYARTTQPVAGEGKPIEPLAMVPPPLETPPLIRF